MSNPQDEVRQVLSGIFGDGQADEIMEELERQDLFGQLVELASLIGVMDSIMRMMMTVAISEANCTEDHREDEQWAAMVKTLIPSEPTVADLSAWMLLDRVWSLVKPIVDEQFGVLAMKEEVG